MSQSEQINELAKALSLVTEIMAMASAKAAKQQEEKPNAA